MKTLIPVGFALLLSFFSSFTSSFCAVRTWTGGGAIGVWTDNANWGGMPFPTAGDDAVFNGGANITFTSCPAMLSLNSIQITGRSVAFDGTANCALTLTGVGSFINGAGEQLQFITPSFLTVAAGATLTFSGTTNYFCNGNNTFINGTVNVDAGCTMDFIWGCVTTVGAGGILNNAGIINLDHMGTSNISLVINGGGTVNNTGTISVGAEVAMFQGTLRIMDNGTFTGNTPGYGAGSRLEYTGAVAKTVGAEFPTGVNMNGLVIVQNTGGVTLGAGVIYSIAGGLTLNAPLALNTNTILDFVGGSVCWGAPIQGNATASMRILAPISQGCSCLNFSAPQELNQLVINASGLSIGSDLTINGVLDIGVMGVQLNVGNCGARTLTLRGGGTVVPANGIRIQGGSVLNIEGNSPLAGAGSVLYDSGSELRYSGAVAVPTPGIEFPATAIDASLRVTNTAGVTINSNKQVNGGVSFGAGGRMDFPAALRTFAVGGAINWAGAVINGDVNNTTFDILASASSITNPLVVSGGLRGIIYRPNAPLAMTLGGTWNIGIGGIEITANGTLNIGAGTKFCDGNIVIALGGLLEIQPSALLRVEATRIIAGLGTLRVNSDATLAMRLTGIHTLPTTNFIYDTGVPNGTLQYVGIGNTTVGNELPNPMPGNVSFENVGTINIDRNQVFDGSVQFGVGGNTVMNISPSGPSRTYTFNGPLGFNFGGAGGFTALNQNNRFIVQGSGATSGQMRIQGQQPMEYLEMNRAGQALTLGSPLSLNGFPTSLALNNGVIITTPANILHIENTNDLCVVHNINASWVIGPMRWSVAATAINKFFPVGDATGYLGCIITGTSSAVGFIEVQTHPDAGGKTGLGGIITPFSSQALQITPAATTITGARFNAYRFTSSFTGSSALASSGALGGAYSAMPTQAFSTNNIETDAPGILLNNGTNTFLAFTSFPSAYYYNMGDPTVLANWGVNPGGTGANPPGFNSGFTFIIESGKTATYSSVFNVPAGVTIQVDDGATIQIDGSVPMGGAGAVTYAGAGATLRYINGAGAGGTGVEFPNAMPGSVEINRPGGFDFFINQGKTVGGTFTLTDGNVFTNGFSHIFNGAFVINGGTYIAQGANATTLNATSSMSGGRIQLTGALNPLQVDAPFNISAGVLELSGPMAAQVDPLSANAVNFTTSAGTLEFTGGWAGTVNVQTLPPTMNGNVDIQNGNVQLAGNQAFNGNLNISSGFLIAGFNLTLAGSGTITTVGLNRINAAALGSTVIVQRATIDGNWFNGNIARNLTLDANATLTNDLTVVDNLGFTSGVLTTSVGNTLIAGQSLSITNATPMRFVNGPMRTTFPMNGVGMTRTLPIGKNGTYLPVELRNVNTNAGANAVIEVEAYDAPSPGSYPLAPLGNEYWRIQTVLNPASYTGGAIQLGRAAAIPVVGQVVFSPILNGAYTGIGGVITPGPINTIESMNIGVAPNDFFAISGAPPSIFYYQAGNPDPSLFASWNSNIGGGGSIPVNFVSGTFIVPNGRTATFSSPFIFGASSILQVETGGGVAVADGQTLTANGQFRINGGGRLTLQGTGNVVAPSGVQYLAPTATLEYSAPANRLTSPTEFPAEMPAQIEIHSGSVRLDADKHLQSAFLLNNSTLSFGAANRLRLSHSATFLGAATAFVSDSTDTLIIDGAGTLAGNMAIPELARLTMNRGGWTLSLAGSLRIRRQLGLFGGNVSTQANERVVLESFADTALLGGNSLSFVSGALERLLPPTLSPVNAPPFFFPVGKGATYLPLTLLEATTGTAQAFVRVEAFASGSGGVAAIGSPGALSSSEFWRVRRVSGGFEGARIGVLRGGLTAQNSLAASLTQSGVYTSVGGTLLPIAQGTSLVSLPAANADERYYAIVGALPGTPSITGFSPSLGGAGSTIVITGTNLSDVNAVAIGGVHVAGFTILSSTSISVVLGAVASGPVQIGSPSGGASSDSAFTFVPSPQIGAVEPNAAAPGATITISGSFAGGLSSLVIGGVVIPQSAITLTPTGGLSVQIPPTATNGTIALSTPGGTVVSTSALAFIGAPRIVSFSPLVGSTGAVLTIAGENFTQSGVLVRFGAAQAFAVTVNSPERMSVVIPPQTPSALALSGASGKNSSVLSSFPPRSVPITVQTAGGVATSATLFVYGDTSAGAPSSPDPLRLIAIGEAKEQNVGVGGRVRVTGANLELLQELRLVSSVGSTFASYLTSSSAEITVLVPRTGLLSESVLSAPVRVEALGAFNAVVRDNLFTVFAAPVATSVQPLEAVAGEEIRIEGENLRVINAVFIGGVPATFRFENGILFARAPQSPTAGESGIPASGVLSFVSTGGVQTTAAVINAALAAGAPFVASVNPPNGEAGATLTLRGANLDAVTAATVGGVPVASLTVVSPSEIRLQLSATPPASSSGTIRLFSPFGETSSRVGFVFAASLEQDEEAVRRALELAGASPDRLELRRENNRIVGARLVGAPLNANAAAFIRGLLPLTALRDLELANAGLTGAFPEELADFPLLERLNLSGNALEGRLPEAVCRFANLVVLNASRNRLSGPIPECIATLNKTRELLLSHNRFTGGIPAAIGGMPRLEVFDVQSNELDGELSAEFGRLAAARAAGSGTIVSKITASQTQNAERLTLLNISRNRFTGSLPAEWGLIRSLRAFDASGNLLSGALPASVANWEELEELRLDDNAFAGALPPLNAPVLRVLSLENNRFTGIIPDAYGQSSRLREARLRNNAFSALPRFVAAPRIDALLVANNRLEFSSLLVNAGANVFEYAPQDSVGEGGAQTIRLGDRLRLASGIFGEGTRYRWLRDGQEVRGANAETLSLNNMQVFESGSYVCEATNDALPLLRLVSRAVEVRVTGAQAFLDAPSLLFPSNAAEYIAVRPQFRWTAVSGAQEYRLLVSRSADMRELVLNRVVRATDATTQVFRPEASEAVLERGALYYWQAQALAPAGLGRVSERFSFRVVPLGVDVGFSSIDLGRALVGEERVGEATIANVGEETIEVDSIAVTTNTGAFALLESGRKVVLRSGEETFARARFRALAEGDTTADVRVWYRDASGAALSVGFQRALRGRGSALRVDNLDFDAVRLGRAVLKTARLINAGASPLTLLDIRLEALDEERQRAEGSVFSLENVRLPLEMQAGDTLYVPARCLALTEGDKSRRLIVEWRSASAPVGESSDSARARLTARARLEHPQNPAARLGVRANPPSAPPGATVRVEVYLAEGNADSIYNAATPRARLRVEYDPQTLALDGRRFAEAGARELRSTEASRRVAEIETTWNKEPVIASLPFIAVAGARAQTRLRILDAEWGAPPAERAAWENAVIVEEPLAGEFTALLSRAGGVRRIASASLPSPSIVALSPNPANAEIELVFRLESARDAAQDAGQNAEHDGDITAEITNALGARVMSAPLGRFAVGKEHRATLSLRGVTSGSYILRLLYNAGATSDEARLQIVR